jgi:hypothetical protein
MLFIVKGCDFMATSSFTKEFIIGEEEAKKLADMLDNKEQSKCQITTDFKFNDEEFIEKCFT